MLFPTVPDRRPDLWPAFTDKVAAGNISFIVHSGDRLPPENPQEPMSANVDELVSLFRAADVVWFGASRGHAIGPFFAFELDAGNARLVEYAIDPRIQSASDEATQEQLQSIAINLFFERKDFSQISLPIVSIASLHDMKSIGVASVSARQAGSTSASR